MEERIMEHELKTDPTAFEASFLKKKPYEIRFDDRGFKEHDVLILKETKYSGIEMKEGKPLIYTGRELRATIRFILRGPIYGLLPGWVILS
jgi:hypothetical protein